MATVLLAGYGDIAKRLTATLVPQHHCIGARRHPEAITAKLAPETPVLAVDFSDINSLAILPHEIDYLLITLTPTAPQPAAYRETYQTALGSLLAYYRPSQSPTAIIQAKSPQVIYVSSSAVYGEDNGVWVDDSTPAQPTSATAQILKFAEDQVLSCGLSASVVRFSGIYGRSQRLLKQVADWQAGRVMLDTPQHWTNRIHVEDCVGVLAFLIAQHEGGVALQPYYLASDIGPVRRADLYAYVSSQMQLGSSAKNQGGNKAKNEAMNAVAHPELARSSVAVNALPARGKRCDAQRLRELGYRFRYPSYREGYAGDELARL